MTVIPPEEQTPLLAPENAPSPSSHKNTKPLRFTVLCIIFLLTVEFGSFVMVPPGTEILESIICRQYYDAHDPNRFPGRGKIPERDCKVDKVDGEVALIQGVLMSLYMVPSVLLAIPYGQIADNPKYGRKFVARLSLCGILLSGVWEALILWFSDYIPVRSLWLSPIFMFMGGGNGVLASMVCVMITDVVEPGQRATAFFQLELVTFLAQFLAPPISAWMMETDSWTPYLLGMALCFASAIPLLLMSETMPPGVDTEEEEEEVNISPETPLESSDSSSKRVNKTLPRSQNAVHQVWQSWKFILSSRLLLLLPTFFIFTIGSRQANFLLLYASKRYGITIAQAGFLLSIFSAVNVALLLLVLPAVSTFMLSRLGFSSNRKDLWLARFSITIGTMGCFMIAFSPNIPSVVVGLVVYTLSVGLLGLVRSLITSFVETHHVARLYSIVSIVQTTGVIVAGPMLAGLFKLGFAFGGEWAGLPFLVGGGMHFVVVITLWLVRLPKKTEMEDPSSPEE
ncbi:MAG: hypothetical protein MMC33_005480 [Icmadophila ericetorum]|nr:hypothetical protein [Icmadophila ericetorum]